jgi:hypothetical protein
MKLGIVLAGFITLSGCILTFPKPASAGCFMGFCIPDQLNQNNQNVIINNVGGGGASTGNQPVIIQERPKEKSLFSKCFEDSLYREIQSYYHDQYGYWFKRPKDISEQVMLASGLNRGPFGRWSSEESTAKLKVMSYKEAKAACEGLPN